MKTIEIRIESAEVVAAFLRAPEVMAHHIDGGVAAGANAVAVEAKSLAPKSLSQLVNSIIAAQVAPMDWEVKAGVLHAEYVESGTGPAAGREKYYPNPDNLLAYLMTHPKARRFERWKRSDRGRLEQEMTLVRRAQAFAWWIYQHGTKAQPFMAPAADKKRSAVEGLIRQSVDQGIAEVFGGGA